MKPIAINLLIFSYCMSFGAFAADVLIFTPLGVPVTGLEGNTIDTAGNLNMFGNASSVAIDESINPEREDSILDRISSFAIAGYTAIWNLITLLTGTFYLNLLLQIGVPQLLITFMQFVLGIAIVLTIIKLVRGIEL